jgi:NAD(P)-dependent dehydrogenase (short-subunit alcohol dehydrogenase family)
MSVFQSGSRALITGGASGIGLAVVEICLKHGMSVSIVDFNKETLDLAQKNLKGDVQILQADVSKEDDWRSVKEKVGDVDFLMLNAGVSGQGTWGDMDYFHKVRLLSLSVLDEPGHTKSSTVRHRVWHPRRENELPSEDMHRGKTGNCDVDRERVTPSALSPPPR